LLALQAEDFPDADASLKRALEKGYGDPDAAYMALGQAAEGGKRTDEALSWYGKVEGERIKAQVRSASLIARRDGLERAREKLRGLSPQTPPERLLVVQAEAQLLREAKAWQETFDHLSEAIERHPDSFELLYDRAMVAERVNRLDVLEADLRRVIELKPEYAHAYNALGYTLADRNTRIDEAYALIARAIALAPDDPFILDSLGWVEYRRGNLEEAVKHLRNAYRARPDPEIAAHLGEVLWQVGERDEARRVWRAGLADNPDHEALRAVIQKFEP
jgi:tetratricopeptide (TPR) repeat protein